MNAKLRPWIGLAVIIAAGFVRLPVERRMIDDFIARGLLSEPPELELRERLGQNSSAIALSGLRSLVATFAHLRATEAFTRQQWHEVDDAMNTAVMLEPRAPYYWDMGGWHLGYNASSYYLNDAGLPPLAAKAEARRWAGKGREFLERGTRNNPGEWRLHASLGRLLSDAGRAPDPAAAAEAYAMALANGGPPALKRYRLYAAARAGTDPEKTLEEVRALLDVPRNRTPSLLGIRYSLEYRLSPPDDPRALAVEIFGSEEKALRNLGDYFIDVPQQWPVTGVEAAIRLMEGRKGVSPEDPASYIRQREMALEKFGLAR